MPSMISTAAMGFTKLPVPTAMAFAPARRNSMASVGGQYAAHADDRDVNGLRDLVDHPKRDGLDRGAAQAAGDVGELELALPGVDCGAEKRVDQRERVAAGIDRRLGDAHYVADVGGELGDHGQAGLGSHGADDLGGALGARAEDQAALLDVGAAIC